MSQDTLTTQEALRLLGISRRTFNRWLDAHPVERETVFGPAGVEYRYTRRALDHLVGQARRKDAAHQDGEEMTHPAGDRHDETGAIGHDAPAGLALPPGGHVGEFLDLLADLRDQLANANAREERAVEEARQLREVLAAVAARLPGPGAAPAPEVAPEPVAVEVASPPPPILRPRAVAEAVLLFAVFGAAGLLAALVVWQAQEQGVVDQIIAAIVR